MARRPRAGGVRARRGRRQSSEAVADARADDANKAVGQGEQKMRAVRKNSNAKKRPKKCAVKQSLVPSNHARCESIHKRDSLRKNTGNSSQKSRKQVIPRARTHTCRICGSASAIDFITTGVMCGANSAAASLKFSPEPEGQNAVDNKESQS